MLPQRAHGVIQLLAAIMFDKLKNSTCPAPISSIEAKSLSIGITLHRLLIYISIPCVAITAFFSLFLIFKHLHRYTRPAEQRQIVRLVLTPLVFGGLSLLALIFYGAHEYIMPLPDLYEAFALACLFILFVHYTRNPTSRTEHGIIRAKTRNDFEDDVAQNLKKTWIGMFQYPIVKTILTIAQLASTATGTYCAASNSVHFGHLWITVISNVSLAFCFLTILRFYNVNKAVMTVHRPMLKLLSFKLIVFVIFLENLVFSFIPTPTGLSSNGTVSPRDIKYGLPSALVCIEMVIFSLGFHFTFRSRMYHPSERGTTSSKSMFGACIDVVNPSDIIMDIMQIFSAETTPKYALPSQQPSPAFYGERSPTPHPLMPQEVGVQRSVSPLHMPPQYSPLDPPQSNNAGSADRLGVDTAYRHYP